MSSENNKMAVENGSTTNPNDGLQSSVCSNLSDYYSTGTCLITWMLLPGICGVGFLLNCLAIGIFSLAIHQGHRTPMTVYLITLSMFDSVQLLFSIFIITFGGSYFLIAPNGDLLVSQQAFNAVDWMRTYATVYVYPLLMAANYGSIWVVTLICVQRYFAICYPLTSLRTVELRRAVNEVLLISAAAVALNFCRFWEFRLEHFVDPTSNQTYPMVNFGPFRNETAHPYYLLAMDGVLYTVLLYALPFTIVSILNVRIVMAIYRARILNQFIGESSRNRREHRSALMVLAIILLFFICYTLAVAERIWSILDEDGANSEFGGFLNAVSNLMVNLNSTIDPLIYFLFSRGFKDLFMKMRKKKNSDMTTALLQSRSASLIISKKTSSRSTTYLSSSPITNTTIHNNNDQATLPTNSTVRPLLTSSGPSRKHTSITSSSSNSGCNGGCNPRKIGGSITSFQPNQKTLSSKSKKNSAVISHKGLRTKRKSYYSSDGRGDQTVRKANRQKLEINRDGLSSFNNNKSFPTHVLANGTTKNKSKQPSDSEPAAAAAAPNNDNNILISPNYNNNNNSKNPAAHHDQSGLECYYRTTDNRQEHYGNLIPLTTTNLKDYGTPPPSPRNHNPTSPLLLTSSHFDKKGRPAPESKSTSSLPKNNPTSPLLLTSHFETASPTPGSNFVPAATSSGHNLLLVNNNNYNANRDNTATTTDPNNSYYKSNKDNKQRNEDQQCQSEKTAVQNLL